MRQSKDLDMAGVKISESVPDSPSRRLSLPKKVEANNATRRASSEFLQQQAAGNSSRERISEDAIGKAKSDKVLLFMIWLLIDRFQIIL